ncbi:MULTISPECIES: LmeA family phospholipid-binding protein [unclassified Streptomyces]|uniref:LmeA family phospholipid-binding protein n=1 Tax=unclassified Streptomyces TaxID=2593676 RepID=UPI0033A9287C
MSHRRRVALTAICLTAVVAAAVTTDLVVEHQVRGRVAKTAACRLGAAEGVQVDLDDTLAGLEALTGTVGAVHVSAEGVRRQGTDMDVDVHLRDVSTGGATSGGTATATIAYDALDRSEGVRSGSGAGGLKTGTDGTRLTLTGAAGGAGLPVTVVTGLSTTSHSLTITPASVLILGREVPVSELSALPGAAALSAKLKPRTIDIQKLPQGTTLVGAHAESAGLVLDFKVAAAGGERAVTTARAASVCASGRGRADS